MSSRWLRGRLLVWVGAGHCSVIFHKQAESYQEIHLWWAFPWMTSYMKHKFAETFFFLPPFFSTQTKKSIAKRNRTQPAQKDAETILVYALRGFTSVGRVSKMLSGINRLSLLEPLRVYHQWYPDWNLDYRLWFVWEPNNENRIKKLNTETAPYSGQVLSVQCTRSNAQPLNKVVHLMHKVRTIMIVVQVGAVKIYVSPVGGAQENGKTGWDSVLWVSNPPPPPSFMLMYFFCKFILKSHSMFDETQGSGAVFSSLYR
jgi:hypothetical protein